MSYFFEKTSELNEDEVVKCFKEAPSQLMPEFVGRLLNSSPMVSQKTLTKVLEYLVASSFCDENHAKAIRAIIKAGASAEGVILGKISNNNDVTCACDMEILNANKELYKDPILLEMKKYGARRADDLNYLSDSGTERSLCPEAIVLLVQYNPELRNISDQSGVIGFTSIHYYLSYLRNPLWNINIAKLLMTSRNINMQEKTGRTPLHILLAFNEKSRWDRELIQMGLKLGANLNIRDKEGVSVRDLILKRHDLLDLLAYPYQGAAVYLLGSG